MENANNLTDHFLIAMPGIGDPRFQHTVTYLCEHNENGAMGLVVNRPLEMRLGDVLQHMDIFVELEDINNARVYQGGPVQPERGFVLHRPANEWESTLHVTDDISVTTSRDVLDAMAHGQGPHSSLIALGYAGWQAGQLEQELLDNAWLSGPADRTILFDTEPEQRWQAAAQLLGVDVDRLSLDAGHA